MSLSSPNLEYYYFTIRACYGWMADNTVDLHVKQTYLKKTELYRDSLLKILPQGSNRNIVLAEKMILSGQADQAIPILNKVLTSPLDMQEKSIRILYSFISIRSQERHRHGNLLPCSDSPH